MIWTLVIFLCTNNGCTSQQMRMPSKQACEEIKENYGKKWEKLPIMADISCVAEAK